MYSISPSQSQSLPEHFLTVPRNHLIFSIFSLPSSLSLKPAPLRHASYASRSISSLSPESSHPIPIGTSPRHPSPRHPSPRHPPFQDFPLQVLPLNDLLLQDLLLLHLPLPHFPLQHPTQFPLQDTSLSWTYPYNTPLPPPPQLAV